MVIDLNCDMGESYGRYILGDDEKVMDSVTSVNIACGMHAGDPVVILRTVKAAIRKGKNIGAHPGYPDIQGFGRRNMDLSPEELEAFILYQIGGVDGILRSEGGRMTHVKPHGALYNKASVDAQTAETIARAVRRYDARLILVGQAGSKLISAGIQEGLPVAAEGFPDRAYEPDGTLRSRRLPGAVLDQPDVVAENAVHLAKQGIEVKTDLGVRSSRVETLCIHGDSEHAVENAQKIYLALSAAGISMKGLKQG